MKVNAHSDIAILVNYNNGGNPFGSVDLLYDVKVQQLVKLGRHWRTKRKWKVAKLGRYRLHCRTSLELVNESFSKA